MIASGVTREQLDAALAAVSAQYDGNIQWNREPERQGGPRSHSYRLTLRTTSSKAPGHRLTRAGHRHVAACWHVHRDFLEVLFALVPNATVRTALATYRGREGFHNLYPQTGARNIGSTYAPMDYDTACEC